MDTTLVGGAADDTYTASGTTLTSGDQLDGGAGTDTLNITTTAAASIGTGVTSKNVETVNVTATVGTATIDATNFSGVTTVGSNGSTADVVINNLAAIPAVNVTATNNNLTVGIAAAAVAGTADSATINLNGVATGATGNTISINGIETLNIASSGTASGSTTATVTIDATASPNLATVNLTGTAAAKVGVNLGGATATVTGTVTSDAGAHDVSVTADGTDKISVSMGAGNDTVRLGAAPGLATGSTTVGSWTVAGGEGTDTLVVGAAGVSSAGGSNISGFESVNITGGGSVTLSGTTNTVSSVTFDASGGTLAGLAAGATVTQAAGGSATVSNTTGWTGASDSLSVTVGSATASGAITQSLAAALIESATITNLALSTDTTSARSVGVSGSSLKTLTVTGAQPTTITGGGAATVTVDASGVSGNVTLNAGTGGTFAVAAAGASITSAAGNDTITGGAGADSITSGDGNDNITAGAGADVITAGNGNDTIDLGTGNDSVDGGLGNDSITAGEGADTLTGGDGADTFTIGGSNTVLATFSTASAPDVITDFKSGTDKISVGQTISSFIGNFASLQLGLANMTGTDQAFFVTGENQLYIVATKGTYATTDTVVKLNSVTGITKEDLGFGAQGTGASITISGGATVLSTSAKTNASASTTALDDTITGTITAAAITAGNAPVGGSANGGGGNDTLNITTHAAGLTSLLADAGVATEIALTSIENVSVTLSDELGGTLTLKTSGGGGTEAAAMPTDLINLTVNGANAALKATVTAAGQVFTVNNTQAGGNGSTITFGAVATQTATTGASDDTFEAIGVDGITVNGGGGNDTFKVSAVAAFDDDNTIISIAGSTGTADAITFADGLKGTVDFTDTTDVSISGIETLNLGAVDDLGGGKGDDLKVTLFNGLTALTGTTDTNKDITVVLTAAQLDVLTTIDSKASNGAFKIAVSAPTADVSVNLSDTDLKTVANIDEISFAAVTSSYKANVTINKNTVVVGGAGSSDTLTVNADINATLGASAFETVAITAAQTGITIQDSATTVTTTKGGVFTLGAGGDKFTNNADAAVTVTGGTGADTITQAGSSAIRVVATAGGDTVTATGTGAVTIAGIAGVVGVTTVNLNASNAAQDIISFADGGVGAGVIAAVDRIVVTGFNTAGDLITLDTAATTAGTAAGAAPVLQVVSAAGAVTFANTNDVLILNFDMGGTAEVLAGDLTGTNLLANLGGTLSITATTNKGYIVAYDNGNAYIYYVVEGDGTGDTTVAAADIKLIGVISGAAVGSLGAGDFALAG